MVETAGTRANPQVTAWGVAPLPVGAFSENSIANPELIADTLSNLLVSSGVKGTDVAAAVSSSHAITKVLGMPAGLGELELEEQINIEALHFIPYPIDEVNIDHEVLCPSTNNDDENEVLLVACRSSIVDDYVDLMGELELNLKYLDIDTYALERVYRSQNNLNANVDGPVAIFDIGSTSSHLLVLDVERVLYSRHQNFGAAQLVKLVRKEYGVSADEAEEILNSAQPPADFLQTVQEPFVEMLRQEVSRALQFFYSSSSYSNIDSVILAGACGALAGIGGDLELKLKSKVVVMNPFSEAAVMSRRDAVLSKAPGLAVAYGLSLRGLN